MTNMHPDHPLLALIDDSPNPRTRDETTTFKDGSWKRTVAWDDRFTFQMFWSVPLQKWIYMVFETFCDKGFERWAKTHQEATGLDDFTQQLRPRAGYLGAARGWSATLIIDEVALEECVTEEARLLLGLTADEIEEVSFGLTCLLDCFLIRGHAGHYIETETGDLLSLPPEATDLSAFQVAGAWVKANAEKLEAEHARPDWSPQQVLARAWYVEAMAAKSTEKKS